VKLRYRSAAVGCRIEATTPFSTRRSTARLQVKRPFCFEAIPWLDLRPSLSDRHLTSDEIRELYLSFFEGQKHTRLPSASLVPATFDAS